jgi:hypothetical protein
VNRPRHRFPQVSAWPAVVVPAGLLGTGLVVVAVVSGKVNYATHHLPGVALWTLLLLLVVGAVAAHRLLGTDAVLPSIDPDQRGNVDRILRQLGDLERDVERETWGTEPDPIVVELDGPWFGTAAVEHPTNPRWDKRLATDADVTP